MIILREQASAKINLFLHILGKRKDGYHLLDSLVVFADIGDTLEARVSDMLTLAIQGPGADMVSAQDNSVIRAAEALRKYAGLNAGVALTLYKHLPVAAGVGGGSADAAAALRLLQRFWNIKITSADLNAIGLSLGADVPACLRSESLYMSGIGEIIEAGPPLTGMPLILVNPGKALATAEVFSAYKSGFSEAPRHPQSFETHQACAGFLSKARNDLEEPAMRLMPEIGQVLAEIKEQEKCSFVRMSGSGATCYGIFENVKAAQKAARDLANRHSGWWVQAANVL